MLQNLLQNSEEFLANLGQVKTIVYLESCLYKYNSLF